MDILEGDVLVIGTKEYPIKSCGDWGVAGMSTRSFRHMATTDASTKRTKKSEPATNLTGLKCIPLMPVDPELRKRLALETPHELKQTFIADATGFVHLIVEELKR